MQAQHADMISPNAVRPSCLMLLLALMLCASLSGCGVRTAYNNLDGLAVRWVNQQVRLERNQEALLRAWLVEELAWHCATQLASYQALVEQIHLDLLAGRLDQHRMAEHGEVMARHGRTLTERSLPMLTELAASLNDAQVEQVLAAFDQRTEQVRTRLEEHSSEDLAADRLAGMERSLRRLMGRSNAAQRQRLSVWAHAITPTEHHHLQQRLYWQGRLAVALEQRHDREQLGAEIAALMRPESAWSEDYRAAMEANRRLTLATLEDMLALADTRHINRMAARLSGLKEDFRRLSCPSDTPPTLLAAAASG